MIRQVIESAGFEPYGPLNTEPLDQATYGPKKVFQFLLEWRSRHPSYWWSHLKLLGGLDNLWF